MEYQIWVVSPFQVYGIGYTQCLATFRIAVHHKSSTLVLLTGSELVRFAQDAWKKKNILSQNGGLMVIYRLMVHGKKQQITL